MEHVTIDVHQETHNPGMLTVREALAAASMVKHAGAAHMQDLLDNPDKAPEFLQDNPKKGPVKALLFAGTIETDDNGNEYVVAVYKNRLKALVTEKYWLADLMLENLCFATIN